MCEVMDERGAYASPAGGARFADAKREAFRCVEIEASRSFLAEANGNKPEAARRVGLSYRALWAKVKESELESS